jgi:nucleoside 2-deoxyribosyltransferase
LIQCDPSKRILIVGQVFIDRHLDHQLIRLGGVFHLARVLDALAAEYAVAYVCPSYMDDDCETFFARLNARRQQKVGNVTGAPNLMEVGHSGEGGTQLYNDLLRESRRVRLDPGALRELIGAYQPTDMLVSADCYDDELLPVLSAFNARLHIDTDHDKRNVWNAATNLATVLCSTSGASFQRCMRKPIALMESWKSVCAGTIILKENRGGSRAWTPRLSDGEVHAPAYPTTTLHSVGVGDCFDAAWVAASEEEALETRLKASSYIASLYAATFDHAAFVNDVHTAMNIRDTILGLEGVRLPWEHRPAINIYLAAPDFPYVNTVPLHELDAAIRYHNFRARRPIQENGLATSETSVAQRRSIYSKDVELLEQCQLLIAVPLIDDPGTFAELGWFSKDGKPTILYDPARRISNAFVINAATSVCFTLTSVIDRVFEHLGRSEYGI